MNNLSHKNYSELQHDAQTVRDAIAAKQIERQALAADIHQLQKKIDDLSDTLAKEERVMASASKLNQPTMTAVEFMSHRKELEAMRGELPTMNEALAFLDRSVNSLQDELKILNNWIGRKLEMYSKDLVAQLAASVIETSGEAFKGLVAAVIAANGRQMGYTADVKSLFVRETASTLCDELFKILSDTDGYCLPDLDEARQLVADRLAAIAEAV